MLKYRGIYRVIYEMDKCTGKPGELAFIPCLIRKRSSIYRYDKSTLAVYIPGIKTANRLIREYSNIFSVLAIGDSEAVLLLRESNIEQAAKILRPTRRGRSFSPRSIKHKKYI